MRIVSLVPHATELLFALGAGSEVIAVTHECDYPPQASTRQTITRDVLPTGLTAGQIDAAVRERTLAGESIYELDEQLLAACEPDLIVTQALCSVCAVSHDQVFKLAKTIASRPRVVSLDPTSFGETLGDIHTLAQATGRIRRGDELVAGIAARVDRVRFALGDVSRRPRMIALEWLDPVFLGGHWVPQMIELAGGYDPLGLPGKPSQIGSWEQVRRAEPEILLVIPCGYDVDGTYAQAIANSRQLIDVGAQRVVAVDASAYFSRPGPRLIDGLELLAHILHPDRLPPTSAQALEVRVSADLQTTPPGLQALHPDLQTSPPGIQALPR